MTWAASSPASLRKLSVRELLGPRGPLSRTLAGYEPRAGQLDMAEAIERALREERILICEAGTGTGKTFAYLVPALLSGRKVVISTATRALQEQIAGRDLPFIEQTLGLRTPTAVMKGLRNYVCLRRWHEFRSSPEALRPGFARALSAVESWVDGSEAGDVGELVGLGEDDPIWREITASSETRVGPPCEFFEECFVTRMKREAEIARVVIVNHHLFFADLALRGPHPGRVIPDYDAVIFDEAHQLEDVATDFFGSRVSTVRIERLARDAERALDLGAHADTLLASGRAAQAALELRTAAEHFFQKLGESARGSTSSDEPRTTLEHDAFCGPVEHAWHRLDAALEALGAFALATRGRLDGRPVERGRVRISTTQISDSLDIVARRADALREELASIVHGMPGRVTWLDRGARGASLSSSPVDLSGLFRERVFESIPAVVLTSATLADRAPNGAATRDAAAELGGSQTEQRSSAEIGDSQTELGDSETEHRSQFSFTRARLGITGNSIDATELVVSSPFDFERRALFYVPSDLPAPNDPRFLQRAAERIAELVTISKGGAFVLTTSLRSMRELHRLLLTRISTMRILLQGQAPKRALIGAFRASGDAVLVATMSFWEGVDVPGHALRLVVLEKAPFLVPTDPIVRARADAVQAEGRSAFMDYHVPAAGILLKQGFGRLIRTKTDAGVIALFDTRVRKRGYGQRLLAQLPPARRTERIEDVREFFATIGAESTRLER